MSEPETMLVGERGAEPRRTGVPWRFCLLIAWTAVAVFLGRLSCAGPLPPYDARFERLARNLEHASATLRGPIPSTYGLDARAERLLKDAEFRAGDYTFDVGGGVRRRVCNVRNGRAALAEDVFALWEECIVPLSGGTWPVRVVRLRADGVEELGSFAISKRLCAGRSNVAVPPALCAWGSFWAYGEPNPDACPNGERRRLGHRGLPSLIRVDLRHAEVDVVPLTFHFELGQAADFPFIFWDEELRRFYGTIDVSPDFIFGKPPEARVVLREDLTGIEASLKR